MSISVNLYYYGKNGKMLCSVDLLSVDDVECVHIPKEVKKKSLFERIIEFFRS